MRIFKKLFLHSPMHYGIAFASAVIFTIIYIGLRQFAIFHIPDGIKTAGLILTLVGLLILSIFYGTFDTFGYAFSTFRKKEKRKYEDLVEYSRVKASERKLKNLIYMPYIVTGLFVLVIGFGTGLFIKPLPNLSEPTNLLVEEVNGDIILSWDRNSDAVSGYVVYYSEYITSNNQEDMPDTYKVEVAQQDTDRITITIKIDDISKSYIFDVACVQVEGSYNGSYYSEIIFNPNN